MNLRLKENWDKFFEEYRNSGLSKTEFCRVKKIASHSFFYFQKLHSPSVSPSATKKNSDLFVPLVEKNKCLTIQINNELRLSFESTPDAIWLANFVKSLGGTNAHV